LPLLIALGFLGATAGLHRIHRLTRRVASAGSEAIAATTKPSELRAGRAPTRLVLGYNLDFPGDWSDALPFLDLMHDARPWEGGGGKDPFAGLDLDEHGWPRSLNGYGAITSIVHTGAGSGFVGHEWRLSYRGEGTLTVDGMVDVLEQKRGSIRFRGKAGNVWITIRATDPAHTGSYIRDITIVREDRRRLLAEGKIFNPDFLAFLAPFRSLRFMDWMLSNDREPAHAGRWSTRAKTDQPQWRTQFIDPKRPSDGLTAGGYPVEVMVSLANQLGAAPHFNMPYQSDDAYVRAFATQVKNQLAPALGVTVEYSNEVWNWGFPQATYARLQAEKLWPGEGTGWLQFMGARATTICRMWKDVFSAPADKGRVRCLIAPQTGWFDVASASLDCPRWAAMGHEPCHRGIDAIAITGYFNGLIQAPENATVVKAWLERGKAFALDRAFRQLEQGDVSGLRAGDRPADAENSDSLRAVGARFRAFRALADRYGLDLYVYEGGTHFDNDRDATVRDFLVDVTRDPRMEDLYLKLFRSFAEVGGTVFNVWGGIGEHSAWANAASLTDRASPKYRAAAHFATGRD
jgi:hypothetical protein